jgi:hypothetical protein
MYVLILRGLVVGAFCMGFVAPPGSGQKRFARGADELMLSELDGLHQGSGEAGDRGSGFAFDLAIGDAGQEAGDSFAEIVAGDVISGQRKR